MVDCSGSHVVDVVVGDKRIVEVDNNSSRINSVICESSLVNDCDDFGGVPGFRIALAKYAVECDFAVNYLKNNATRLDNVHNCGIVARRSCSKMVAWLGVHKARGGLFGDFATSFDQLQWYLETSMRTNPRSVFELDVDESSRGFRRLFVEFHECLYDFQFCRPLLFVDGTFLKERYKGHLLAAISKDGNQGMRLFVAFHGCLYGFQFCRPLLFVDGTFLKERYKGHFLAAISKDGNQGLFPLAFAIVDTENQDNWMWFLSQLLKAVSSGQRLTFVSDRQHGLLDALSVIFPNAHHAYCLNHLKRNLIDKLVGLSTNYKLTLMKILVKCTYAPNVASF
ncbi:uncharacterized protein LOC114297989 [Camellia sinensis]|uniref:uncharacterized protein LOC114297989 n=1 Tax=Camellia sinensis TaxID=4442 RepID=UPI00103695F4|nr:uncharacterized protein LOC114297989 [Camellia sinensis]